MGGGIAIAIISGVAILAVVVARGGLRGARYTIAIRGNGTEGVRLKGTVPGHAHSEVAAFVAELDLPTGARIWGVPEGDRLVLQFSAAVPEHLHQRLRNFLYLHR